MKILLYCNKKNSKFKKKFKRIVYVCYPAWITYNVWHCLGSSPPCVLKEVICIRFRAARQWESLLRRNVLVSVINLAGAEVSIFQCQSSRWLTSNYLTIRTHNLQFRIVELIDHELRTQFRGWSYIKWDRSSSWNNTR